MEYDIYTQKFKVINRIEIAQGAYTFDNAVEKIKVLNDIYNPAAIYLDRGAGEYQIETLRKYGLNHPETGLHKKIHGIHFGSSKEVIDPHTKQIDKKPIKAFMVDQLTILFERDRITVNESDEMIIRQLENYRVVRKSMNGTPIFVDEDEHTVDCISLCILGFVEQFPELVNIIEKINKATQIHAVGIKYNQEFNPELDKTKEIEWDELGPAPMQKVEVGTKPNRKARAFGWSTRGSNINKPHKRSSW